MSQLRVTIFRIPCRYEESTINTIGHSDQEQSNLDSDSFFIFLDMETVLYDIQWDLVISL